MYPTIRNIIYAIVATASLAGCADDMPDGLQPGGIASDAPGFHLRMEVPLSDTRAPGDDPLNEFKVSEMTLFFFRAAGFSEDTSEYVFSIPVPAFDFNSEAHFEFPRGSIDSGGILGDGARSCYVYAVANVAPSALGSRTVAGMKSTLVSASFARTHPQAQFAMDCFATVDFDRERRVATGHLSLERAAAKLTLSVDVPDQIDVVQTIVDPVSGTSREEHRTYWSHPQEMRVWISNGVGTSPLNTPPFAVGKSDLYSNEAVYREGEGSAFSFADEQPKYKYLQEIPFYSFPNKWDPYTPHGNTVLTVALPWRHLSEAGLMESVVTYYRLNVQPNSNEIRRNTHYDMRVTISRLGGTTVQEPVDMLLDWNYGMEWNVQTLPTDIKEIRYLLLNNNDFDQQSGAYAFHMNNVTEIEIPFSTSHPVEIESVSMTWRDFTKDTDRYVTLTSGSGSYRYSAFESYVPTSDYAGISIDRANSRLKVRRDMLHLSWNDSSPSISKEKAISTYTLKIRVRHADDHTQTADILVTQTPAIYILTQLTPDGTRFINGNNTTYSTSVQVGGNWWNPQYEYTYRGYTSGSEPGDSTQKRYWLGSKHDDSYVKNKNTYIVTISRFGEDDNYIIGDPRSRKVNNLNITTTDYTQAAEWSYPDNGKAQLKHYYPADNNTAKQRFIAPKFRVASQWGVTYDMNRESAMRRCASYQENGRPQGRWRLPTAAEVEFVARLSNKGLIPYLFGSATQDTKYWCASGGIQVINMGNNPHVEVDNPAATSKRAVRCVYDEWYWGADTLTNKKQAVWGDRLRK